VPVPYAILQERYCWCMDHVVSANPRVRVRVAFRSETRALRAFSINRRNHRSISRFVKLPRQRTRPHVHDPCREGDIQHAIDSLDSSGTRHLRVMSATLRAFLGGARHDRCSRMITNRGVLPGDSPWYFSAASHTWMKRWIDSQIACLAWRGRSFGKLEGRDVRVWNISKYVWNIDLATQSRAL
jgi:hypothetical protein